MDEFLVETTPELAREVGTLMGESYTYAGSAMFDWYNENPEKYSGGDKLHIKPDFNGGNACGMSYYECH